MGKEHPQTTALILSKVKPACAAKVMAQLPTPIRNGITRRMLTFKPIVEATMKMIEQTIHEDFMISLARNAAADTHSRMADIINKMERHSMEEVLDNLTQSRPKSAEILKSLLFTFDDIINLTPRARTTLFDQILSEKVILALKGTSGPSAQRRAQRSDVPRPAPRGARTGGWRAGLAKGRGGSPPFDHRPGAGDGGQGRARTQCHRFG